MEQVIADYIRDVYQKARADSLLMLCAALAFAAGAALLVWAYQRRKPAYLFRKTAKKTFHYVFMAIPALLSVLRFANGGNTLRLTLSLLAVLFAAAGIYGLITWRPLGVVFSLLSLWLSLPLGELATVLGAASDVRNISAFAPTSRIAIYAVACFALSRMAVLALAAAGITAAVVAYYAKRRYLFRTPQTRYFTGISLCPACRAPVIAGNAHCPSCGGNLSQRPGSVLRWKPLDEAKHCKTCGKELDDKGRCRACGQRSATADQVGKDVAEAFKGELKKKLAYVLIPLLVILPVLLGKGLNGLTKDSTLVNNAYVTRFNEWYNDPSVARSADWLDSFDQASDALRRSNVHAFEIDPDKLGYTDFYGYIQYTEACCWQIEAIDCAREAVHAGDTSQKDVIAGVFNETVDMQQRALMSRMNVIGGNLFQQGINMVIDACRFYLSFLPAFVFPILLILLAVAGLAFGIVLLTKSTASSPFVTAAPSPDVSPKDVIASDIRRKAYLRRERTVTLAGMGLALLLLAACFGLASAKNKTEAPPPQNPLYTAFAEDGGRIVAWLSACDTDPEEARAQLETMEGVIDDCLRNLAYIAEDPEADEEAAAITALITPELKALQRQVAQRQLPDRDLQKRIAGLVAEGARLSARNMLQDAFDTLNDA